MCSRVLCDTVEVTAEPQYHGLLVQKSSQNNANESTSGEHVSRTYQDVTFSSDSDNDSLLDDVIVLLCQTSCMYMKNKDRF